MNEETYEQLEQEFQSNNIDEDVDDVLLDLAEAIADANIMDQEVLRNVEYGKTVVEACGICNLPEDGEEADVWLKWVKIGIKTIKIEDYML